ncbi:hypothetical protein C8R42DRAFT_171341 [Lentinula raphanica]|nr:hypothetical protein C8R42DRAFT_171341 [Lentinula raphanica]
MEASIIMEANALTAAAPNNTRKRNRENETPSQRIKREKAAERQRRKRERDRLGIPVNYVHPPPQRNPTNAVVVSQPLPPPPPPPPQPPVTVLDPNAGGGPSTINEPELTPEEEARRDRVRAAARERQRKHRALVKQRKMRELGMDMGNDISDNVHAPSTEEQAGLSYSVDAPAGFHAAMISPPPPPPPGIVQQSITDDTNENSFPQTIATQGHGGQMFATTLLLSFSCSPLLKQHLLSSLQMSNEELASLEPIIADAWDQWDRQRRQHQQPFDTSQFPSQHSFVQNAANSTPQDVSTASAANEFRARFHRSLIVPTPFQAQAAAAAVHSAQVVQATVSGSLNGISEDDGSSSKADQS